MGHGNGDRGIASRSELPLLLAASRHSRGLTNAAPVPDDRDHLRANARVGSGQVVSGRCGDGTWQAGMDMVWTGESLVRRGWLCGSVASKTGSEWLSYSVRNTPVFRARRSANISSRVGGANAWFSKSWVNGNDAAQKSRVRVRVS